MGSLRRAGAAIRELVRSYTQPLGCLFDIVKGFHVESTANRNGFTQASRIKNRFSQDVSELGVGQVAAVWFRSLNCCGYKFRIVEAFRSA